MLGNDLYDYFSLYSVVWECNTSSNLVSVCTGVHKAISHLMYPEGDMSRMTSFMNLFPAKRLASRASPDAVARRPEGETGRMRKPC